MRFCCDSNITITTMSTESYIQSFAFKIIIRKYLNQSDVLVLKTLSKGFWTLTKSFPFEIGNNIGFYFERTK